MKTWNYLLLCLMIFVLLVSCKQKETIKSDSEKVSSIETSNPEVVVDHRLCRQLTTMAKELGLTDYRYCGEEDGWETISLAVIYEKDGQTYHAGVTPGNFIYPASVYKMYVAAEMLHQIEQGKFSLDQKYTIKSPNDVDLSKQIPSDPRPLLRDGDEVTIEYLLDLMITRSDNSAANCLIDLATRPKINQMMHKYGWYGSEVTRKFLSTKYEDEGYTDIRGTETSAQHAAEFLYLIQKGKLYSPWVSEKMKELLSQQLDNSKLSEGLPTSAKFAHKTGWWSHWTNDVGIVEDGENVFVLALFMPVEEELALPLFKQMATKVHDFMTSEVLK